MTDTTTGDIDAQPIEQAAAEPETGSEPHEVDYKAEAEKWKALSRKNEDQARANAEKAKQFDSLEEANKTELQKAQDALTVANEKASQAELRAIRASISAKTGVPEDLLHGTTQEDLDLSAQAAIAWRGTQTPAASRVGGADLTGGAAKPAQYTRAQIADREFYKTHRDDILLAQSQGRIT